MLLFLFVIVVVDNDVFVLVAPRNLPLKFRQNWKINIFEIIVFVVVVAVQIVIVVVVDPRNQHLTFGQNSMEVNM